ncbi:MAG TPA: hypothetical protein VFG10_09880 [Saprospiraceae bacterium]|nr:hypothetical protein [Saprospiraceae bacterium]
MSDKHEKIEQIKFIREICKGKKEEELLEAEENFREYLLVIKGMCDRLADNTSISGFDE